MRDFKFVKRGIVIGGLIATSIFVSASNGTGSTNDRGRMTNGRNMRRRRSCGPLPDTMMTLSLAIMNSVRDKEGGVEIAYFGLLPELIGRGLGGALLTSAIEEAWRHGAEPVTCVGAYVQPRSSAGARELSGAWDDRLQGRGRGFSGGVVVPGKLSASPTKCVRRHVSQARAPVFASKSKKFSDFLKCPASKSLERNETNQINNRYDEHGSRQPYY